MILFLIALVSLSAIYFTRLLSSKKMKIAAISVAALYIYIIAWTYAMFILDVADLGFSDAKASFSLVDGSEIYRSFVVITQKMAFIPEQILYSIVLVAAVVLTASIAVAFHGLFEISREICRFVKQYRYLQTHKTEWIIKNKSVFVRAIPIIRLYCRANC